MAITPNDFDKIWSSNASTPAYTFNDADYLEGWDFVGNLPPTRAQWNAIQKRTDEKMKYVFDNFGAPLTASTVAEMTMQNRVYVYTGSETGYTAGHWYYWNGSVWTDGGVYNSTAFSTDTTLTISGQAADAKATGDAIKSTKAEMSLFGVDDLLWDNTNPTSWTHNGITYTVNKINKTVTLSGTATNTSVLVFYNNTIPAWLTAGKTYYAHLNTDQNVFIQVRETVNGTESTILSAKGYGEFAINASATNIVIRLTVFSGNTVNTTVRPFISERLSLNEMEEKTEKLCKENQNTLPSVIANIQPSVEWLANMTVSDTTGELFQTTYNYSATKNKIEIPKGSKAYVHLPTSASVKKVALYDKTGDFIETYSLNDADFEIDSKDASYFRLQYPSVNTETIGNLFAIRFVYNDGSVAHKDEINDKISDSTTKISASGNPLVLANTSLSPFSELSMSGQSQGKEFAICGKNIFTFYYNNQQLVNSGVTYQFDRENGTIRVTSDGATNNSLSATSVVPGDGFTTLNGISSNHNFHFKFSTDTYVAVHGHCSEHQTYDYPVQMRVSDGTTIMDVGEDGLVFLAKSGIEYGVYILVRKDWAGDIVFKPQIEIGTHPTEYEKFVGSYTTYHPSPVLPTIVGENNIIDILPNESAKLTSADKGYIVVDSLHNNIFASFTTDSNNTLIAPMNYTINGTSTLCLTTFSVTDSVVTCCRAIPQDLKGKAYAQITDGTAFWIDRGDGVLFYADSTKTYALRIMLLANNEFNGVTFTPIIATGVKALELFGSRLGVTTIYTNDSTAITATALIEKPSEKIETNFKAVNGLMELTAGKILTPFSKLKNRKAMITFIDDDTSSVALVQRYHDIFANKGVVGNYAVMTKNLDEQSGLTDLLLDYEEEGFGCLYHCYYQSGDATRYWEANNPAYDETLIKENFMRGLRSMREYGFSNYNMWVTPYGVNDKFIVDLAKNHGMKCLFNCPSWTFNQSAYVSMAGNADRWNLPRISITAGIDNSIKLHSVIDACVADKGWLTIVTHANTWGSGTETDEYVKDIIQYCLDAGAEVTSVPIAFETFYPVFLLSELL